MAQLPEKPLVGQPVSAEWGGRVVDFMRSLFVTGDGTKTKVTHTAGGTTVAWIGDDFSLPFQLSKATASVAVTVGANRAETDYPFTDTITVGLDKLAKTVAETSAVIAATSYIYYTITKSGTTITATLTANVTYPTQVDETWYVVLGKAVVADGAVQSVAQYWYGDIHLPGRLV